MNQQEFNKIMKQIKKTTKQPKEKTAKTAYDEEIKLRLNTPQNKKLKKEHQKKHNEWLKQHPNATFQEAFEHYLKLSFH
jgi:electron transfer flavoprotein alpha/beta subunit